MRIRHTIPLSIALTCAACAPLLVSAPAVLPSAGAVMPSPTIPVFAAPDGWATYASQEVGFAFAYPSTGILAAGDGVTLATISFPLDSTLNITEESIIVSGSREASTCASPLAEGWPPEELAPQTIELGSLPFLRQERSGVAAGTASTWVAYSTQRDDRCVSLGYVLRTFDPGNLDPTLFPTPPAMVDVEQRLRTFESMVATFTWLR